MNKSEIPVAQKSVLSMLIDDHRHVLKLAQDYKKEEDKAAKQKIVQQACRELMMHTQIEEEIFYPFLREQDEDTFADMVDEGIVEHGSVKDLLRELSDMSPDDELYDSKFTVVGEFVEHHVQEEEDEMFAAIIKENIDLRPLYDDLQARREELMAEEA